MGTSLFPSKGNANASHPQKDIASMGDQMVGRSQVGASKRTRKTVLPFSERLPGFPMPSDEELIDILPPNV